jgi:hypothetical protein
MSGAYYSSISNDTGNRNMSHVGINVGSKNVSIRITTVVTVKPVATATIPNQIVRRERNPRQQWCSQVILEITTPG